jgi:hypothetical protein
MAKPMDELRPSREDAELAAGVLNPLSWGVKRGVGSKPNVGARRPGPYDRDGDGSMIAGMLQGLASAGGTSLSGVEGADRSPGGVYRDRGGCSRTGLHGARSSRLSSSGVRFRMRRRKSQHCLSYSCWPGAPGDGGCEGVNLDTQSAHLL